MVGCCLRCLICFFACSSVFLLGACLGDVEASSCSGVIHKKAGDTVELSSCLPADGVTYSLWRYKSPSKGDKDKPVTEIHQFEGRLAINPINFSLTLRKLTLQDSGNFIFLSEVNDFQRETVTITLQVHELITKQPVLTSNSTWLILNESCTVWLECSAAINSNVSYNWTVNNKTISGSRLQYFIRPQDGDTEFTCTIYNFVSNMSAFTTVKCSNETQEPSPGSQFILLSAVGGGCLLIVIVLGTVVGVCYCRRTQPAGSDSNELTVYADITEVAAECQTLSPMKPSSIYEAIEERVHPVTPGPQTVYDKIQLSRVRKQSVSPYQDVS